MLRRELHGKALRALGAEMTDGAADELLAEAAAPISWLQRQRCDLAGIRCGKLRGYMPDDRIVQEGVEAAGCGLAVPNAIKLIENALKEARQGAFRVRNCHDFEKMCMPNRRRRSA